MKKYIVSYVVKNECCKSTARVVCNGKKGLASFIGACRKDYGQNAVVTIKIKVK